MNKTNCFLMCVAHVHEVETLAFNATTFSIQEFLHKASYYNYRVFIDLQLILWPWKVPLVKSCDILHD